MKHKSNASTEIIISFYEPFKKSLIYRLKNAQKITCSFYLRSLAFRFSFPFKLFVLKLALLLRFRYIQLLFIIIIFQKQHPKSYICYFFSGRFIPKVETLFFQIVCEYWYISN